MFLTATLRDDTGESVGVIELAPKTFKSGKQGWFGQSKLEIDGRRCQCQMQAVAITAKGDSGDVEGDA